MRCHKRPPGHRLAQHFRVIPTDRAGSAVSHCPKTPCLALTSFREVKPHRSVQFPEPGFSSTFHLAGLGRKSRRVWQPKKKVDDVFVFPPVKQLRFSGKNAYPNYQVRFDQSFVEIEPQRKSNALRLTLGYNFIIYVSKPVDGLKNSPSRQSCRQESRRGSRSFSLVQSGRASFLYADHTRS
jgi:hypothetical protein